MGRPGLTTHRKFIRLAKMLRSELTARGALELMWEGSYETGDPCIGDEYDLEGRCKWRGTPRALATMLITTGFVDKTEHGLVIHDFWHHVPDYVRKRAKREAERRSLKDPRLVSDRSVTGHCPPNGVTPAPAPAPIINNGVFSKNGGLTTVLTSGTCTSPSAPAFEPKNQIKKFVKPTFEELTNYVTEKGYHFKAEDFIAHYESNGWKIGKAPMRNWQAACRTWESRCVEFDGSNGGRRVPAAKRQYQPTDEEVRASNEWWDKHANAKSGN